MDAVTEYFCKKSGEDIWIINHCGHRGIRKRFALVGVIAWTVGLLSFLSCWYSFKMLFDGPWLAVPVSLLFAWMINNIYRVLLTTLSKPVLKIKYQGVIKHLSLTLRIGFIVLFAVFIAKPLEAWLFEPQLSEKVEEWKALEIGRAATAISRHSAAGIRQLSGQIRHKEHNGYPEGEISPLRQQLEKVQAADDEALERVRFVIGRADFFVQRLQLLTGQGIYRLSWFFTLLVTGLFVWPIYLMRKINQNNPYLQDKKTIYEAIVLKHYADFKAQYKEMFLKEYQLVVEVLENYRDAPFNTERLTDARSFKTQDDFFEQFYHG